MTKTVKIKTVNGGSFLIDKEDEKKIQEFKWYENNAGYIQANLWENKKQKTLYLHRFLMNPKDNLTIDHINGDRKDNRKENLHIVSYSLNLQRRYFKKYKGVTKLKSGFKAIISYEGTRLHLGVFERDWQAALAYDKKAMELYGMFADTNFPILPTERALFLQEYLHTEELV